MTPEKVQFNIYLPPDLVRQVKFAALAADRSLSSFVEEALRAFLEQRAPIEIVSGGVGEEPA